jgi:hypothetical protein
MIRFKYIEAPQVCEARVGSAVLGLDLIGGFDTGGGLR